MFADAVRVNLIPAKGNFSGGRLPVNLPRRVFFVAVSLPREGKTPAQRVFFSFFFFLFLYVTLKQLTK